MRQAVRGYGNSASGSMTSIRPPKSSPITPKRAWEHDSRLLLERVDEQQCCQTCEHCPSVAAGEPNRGLPLRPAGDPGQNFAEAETGLARWLSLRGNGASPLALGSAAVECRRLARTATPGASRSSALWPKLHRSALAPATMWQRWHRPR
jgi:hypothetical protein